jgi:hypothetical protein
VRFGGPPGGAPTWATALFNFSIMQGMVLVILLGLVGVFLQPKGSRFRRGVLGIYSLLLLASLLSGYSYGIHQHGAVFIAWFILIVAVIEPLRLRWPRSILIAGILAVLLPLAQAVMNIRATRAANDYEESVGWIEQHVPAGTTVYALDGGMRALLPTSESAGSLWSEVNDDQAWRKKMESGVTRFKLTTDELPRALGEENLTQERGNRRKWFILGGRNDLLIPRYDIRIVMSSPVFGIQIKDLSEALKARGGILVWRDEYDLPAPALGPPLMQWLNTKGKGVSIYCTPDVRASIK